LSIDEQDDGTVTFKVDDKLRAICEERVPRPELNGWSIRDWMRDP
jgi:hypothetical protein